MSHASSCGRVVWKVMWVWWGQLQRVVRVLTGGLDPISSTGVPQNLQWWFHRRDSGMASLGVGGKVVSHRRTVALLDARSPL